MIIIVYEMESQQNTIFSINCLLLLLLFFLFSILYYIKLLKRIEHFQNI